MLFLRSRAFFVAILILVTGSGCLFATEPVHPEAPAPPFGEEVPPQLVELAEGLDALGAALGVEVPNGATAGARARFLAHHLELLAEDGGDLITFLTSGLRRLPPDVWHASPGELSPMYSEHLTMLSGLVHAVRGKLDLLHMKPKTSPATMAAPGNDECGSAPVIGNESASTTTVGATNDGAASCGASGTAPDVWYRYVAPAGGLVRFSTSASDYDPVLALFDGCPAAGGAELACNDDAGGTVESMVTREVTAGEETWVRVSGFSGAVGELTLTIEPTAGMLGTVVKEASGQPLAGVVVGIWPSPSAFFPIHVAETDTTGSWAALGLGPGTYYAVAGGLNSNPSYAQELFEEISCVTTCQISDGTPIPVEEGSVTEGIDFTLEPRGAIEGKVTTSDSGSGLPSGEVIVWASDGQFVSSSFLTLDRTYRVGGLAPGAYFVSTDTFSHLDELYDGIHCQDSRCDPTVGTPVLVEPGRTTTGIDFALEDLSSITGSLTQSLTGEPLGCGVVSAISTDFEVHRRGSSTTVGAYEIQSLPPGEYFVVAECHGFMEEVWDGMHCPRALCDIQAADGVPVPVASAVGGIDFSLEKLGAIEGAVYSKVTGEPIPGFVEVTAVRVDGTAVEYGSVGGSGDFRLDLLYPGQYRLWAENFSPRLFQTELYHNVPCVGSCDTDAATPVPVALDSTVSGIDFYLSECSALSFKTIDFSGSFSFDEEACEILTIGPAVTVFSGGSAVFRAGKRVVLRDGFALQPGATLRIEIDPDLSTEDQ